MRGVGIDSTTVVSSSLYLLTGRAMLHNVARYNGIIIGLQLTKKIGAKHMVTPKWSSTKLWEYMKSVMDICAISPSNYKLDSSFNSFYTDYVSCLEKNVCLSNAYRHVGFTGSN